MQLLYSNPAINILSTGRIPATAPLASAKPFEAVSAARPIAVSVVYLLSRYHSDPRSMTFAHVLNALDHRGSAYALRISDQPSLADAVAFIDALLGESQSVLVLHDVMSGELDQHALHFLHVTRGAGRPSLPSPFAKFQPFAAQIRE